MQSTQDGLAAPSAPFQHGKAPKLAKTTETRPTPQNRDASILLPAVFTRPSWERKSRQNNLFRPGLRTPSLPRLLVTAAHLGHMFSIAVAIASAIAVEARMSLATSTTASRWATRSSTIKALSTSRRRNRRSCRVPTETACLLRHRDFVRRRVTTTVANSIVVAATSAVVAAWAFA